MERVYPLGKVIKLSTALIVVIKGEVVTAKRKATHVNTDCSQSIVIYIRKMFYFCVACLYETAAQ